MADIKSLARDERQALADFLATLSPSQWDVRTLCTEWTVRQLVAHVVSYEDLDRRALVRRFAEGRFLPGKINAVGVAEAGGLEPDELLAKLRMCVDPRGFTTGLGGRIALVDGMIHHQDIRRPLGLPREIPAERLLPALSFAMKAPPIRAFWRARGLRLVATDLDWSSGRGPEVRGAGEAIMMAAAGRRGVVGELTGPGQPTLARRLGG
ncbi:uncharacterized protein (TIGR03083 family) [Herbihabitans rhizosphaerae]|uniref:Uncharacterized protein (TIGR03083 family) n=1 Tax=Herbihabitans rhizosphaerae TaxID=1872711 RepID=A0A4V2ETJ9_9PSEU|nr:maleylpyruvate isomerase family mycothiol-dependent enzyme [Herbihabitans rhizosphaerae]RZS41333.1 uncharacterized protein (TIGR03083 family) [Herbihabitans rhizosphaerae]